MAVSILDRSLPITMKIAFCILFFLASPSVSHARDICSLIKSEKIKYRLESIKHFQATLLLTGRDPIECEELDYSHGLKYMCGGNIVQGDFFTTKSGHRLYVDLKNFKMNTECLVKDGDTYLRTTSGWEGNVNGASVYMKFNAYTDRKVIPVLPEF
jgi:hypothetical protein